MKNKLNNADLYALRERWKSESGILIIEKLFKERMQLDNTLDGLKAVRNQFEITDLRGIDFSGRDLSHKFLLFDTNLSYCDFSRSKIRGSFQGALMHECDFHMAEIFSGYFAEADLSYSSFNGSIIGNARFYGSDLTHVSFDNVKIIEADFSDVDLTTTSFEETEFGCVKFNGAKITKRKNLYDKIVNSKSIIGGEKIIWIDE